MGATDHDLLVRDALTSNADDLLQYFVRRCDSRDDAADLLSDTMLVAWRRSKDVPADKLAARMWLFGIASKTLLNQRRTLRRRTALAERLKLHLQGTGSSTPDTGETLAVRDAVHRLPHAQRELVILIHWDGFSIAEASEILGLNASTARSRYSAARASLRSSLHVDADQLKSSTGT